MTDREALVERMALALAWEQWKREWGDGTYETPEAVWGATSQRNREVQLSRAEAALAVVEAEQGTLQERNCPICGHDSHSETCQRLMFLGGNVTAKCRCDVQQGGPRPPDCPFCGRVQTVVDNRCIICGSFYNKQGTSQSVYAARREMWLAVSIVGSMEAHGHRAPQKERLDADRRAVTATDALIAAVRADERERHRTLVEAMQNIQLASTVWTGDGPDLRNQLSSINATTRAALEALA